MTPSSSIKKNKIPKNKLNCELILICKTLTKEIKEHTSGETPFFLECLSKLIRTVKRSLTKGHMMGKGQRLEQTCWE